MILLSAKISFSLLLNHSLPYSASLLNQSPLLLHRSLTFSQLLQSFFSKFFSQHHGSAFSKFHALSIVCHAHCRVFPAVWFQ